MKVKKTKAGNFKLKASEDEVKYLMHLIGPTNYEEDIEAGVPEGTGYGIYSPLHDAVNE
ncbi:hypothetical protein [Reyranella sp.]|uniref:hypothetical protein n=1 Tax=Reyranella sp. TaxID=1929291 RepID=UPI0025CBA427|nr:hypothetical protein [Reyranella sp.]